MSILLLMQWLQDLDFWLLMKINRDWTSPMLDPLFVTITDLHKNKFFLTLVVPVLLITLCWKKSRKEILLIVGTLFLSLAMSDLLCGQVLKNAVERKRPPLQYSEVITRVPLYGNRSFPSNHAANVFTLAVVLTYFRPRWSWICFSLAFLVAYSRSYVGVHFPTDWIAGALIGAGIGYAATRVHKRLSA